jgi:2-polyprenyl-6-methoxyphenol hydroxylase-like FAD-dependent oxidoreductase
MSRPVGDRAVVLGASMAGLLAARVLADAYGQVTVVDRDQLPEGGAQRRGVPQGHHIHALLARGQQGLEELFPGLTAELVAQGVPAGDMLANARVYLSGYRLRQAPTGLVLLCASRPVLEGYVRARVRTLPNVALRGSCTSWAWPRRPMVAGSPVRKCSVGRVAAPRKCSAPIWWWMLAVVVRARRCGWRRSGMRGRPRARCGSGSAMRPGVIDCRAAPLAVTWLSCMGSPPSIRGVGRSRCWMLTG